MALLGNEFCRSAAMPPLVFCAPKRLRLPKIMMNVKPPAFALAPILACAASFLIIGASDAGDRAAAPAAVQAVATSAALPDPEATIVPHRVGQVFDYSLHGEVGQSISGRDASGH